MATNIRWQKRVNLPFDQVYKAFKCRDSEILQSATTNAADRTQQDALRLHTSIAGISVHRDVIVEIESRKEIIGESQPRMAIDFSWRASHAASLFPTMNARLSILPVGDHAQLDFRGDYEAPGGVVGQAIDAIIGERIAESSVRNFVDEIVNRLQEIIPGKPPQLVPR